MTKYVELKTAIDAVNDVYYDTPDMNLSADKLEAALRGIPDADVAPVVMGGGTEILAPRVSSRGIIKWYRMQMIGGYFDPMPDYCPNCGARMDGDDDALD